ncbi:MAG: hypothetical protein AMJ73_06965 [candidate division Zixibacteria bacterium SM1_73]|nr:MAG: hypothetical protein AMJ73_06965 [candidate division Zixibacteria bacterium SM1_73]
MGKSTYLVIAALMVSLIIFFGGCGKKATESKPDNGTAAEKVKEANALLEDELYTLVSTELEGVERPEDINFSLANSLYKAALELDPSNLDAHFGAGLTEILIVTLDNSVNEVFDEWDTFLDTASLFEAKSAVNSEEKFAKKIVNRGFPTGKEDFLLPSNFLVSSIFSVFYTGLTNPPQIHEIQDLIDNKLLPKVDYALVHLEKVASDTHYSFIITPEMQGDLEEDSLELDMTEIFLIITGLDLLKSFCSIAIAYNFDFPSYDSAGLAQVIPQNSDFLSMRSTGESKLASAKSAFLDACDDLENAVNFLRGETDNQNDDIIKIDSDGVADDDLDSILTYLPRIRNSFNTFEDVTADFDDDGEDETVAIAVGAFFGNPINNLKQDLLPGYTTKVERDSTLWWHVEPWHEPQYGYEYFLVPVIIWNANSFDQWVFPNPSFNGILPEITTDLVFKQTFGIDAVDWEKEFRLEIFEDF